MTRLAYLPVLITIMLAGFFVVGCAEATQEMPATPEVEETEVSPGLPVNPSGGTSSPTSAIFELDIANFAYSPATITVPAGTTVTWYNRDSTPHTVTTREQMFDSGRMTQGETFSYTFTDKGTFEYYCIFHPYMTGKVIVE
ncbi:cupredoxin family copper-binding protein [Chloroflexota bacterium]